MQKALSLLLAAAVLASCATAPTGHVRHGKKSSATGAKTAAEAQLDQKAFLKFYNQLKADAAAHGHKPELLDAAFSGAPQPIPSVISAEAAQPETTRTFAAYVGPMLSRERIDAGVQNIRQYRRPLENASQHTGVPISVIVALWGIETNFGARQGENPIIPSLVTLAWKSPRGDYFRKEVFASLTVLEKTGMKPSELQGSWAGALGQCQFMPSSYLAYAQDGDGDGKADIWHNEADVFASAATYLQAKGWKAGLPWRVELGSVPNLQGVSVNARGLSEPMSLSAWKKRGLATLKNGALVGVPSSTRFRVYEPQPGGPAFLLGPNFDVVLRWNNSSYFAYSVLSLADMLKAEANL
ncbi:MAG: lytic murein transglycosylase [Proteobacteria bacterium]|nr:lytic murein transglycosylase [Pseudomonadota bacterium]